MGVPKLKEFTADEFFAFTPENNVQAYELYNGEIISLASPNISHQELSGDLYFAIKSYIKKINNL